MRNILCGAIILTLAGCAATPAELERAAARDARQAERLETRLAGFEPERAQSCVMQSNLRSSDTYGQTILYEQSPGRLYRNDTSPGCRLTRDDILVTNTTTGQLCRGDIVRTIDRVARFQTGACTLGDFTSYRRAGASQ